MAPSSNPITVSTVNASSFSPDSPPPRCRRDALPPLTVGWGRAVAHNVEEDGDDDVTREMMSDERGKGKVAPRNVRIKRSRCLIDGSPFFILHKNLGRSGAGVIWLDSWMLG